MNRWSCFLLVWALLFATMEWTWATPPKNQPRRAAQAKEISLDEGLRLLKSSLQTLQNVDGYQCLFVKRERVQNKLTDYQYLRVKLRHEPFSVYTRFLAPDSLKGQEALYVAGKYNNQLIARPAGVQGALIGTVRIDPESALAMHGNRHPITKAGMKNLVKELIHLSETREGVENCRVFLYPQAKVEGRTCQILQISNPVNDGPLRLAHGRLFLDKERNVPLRFECYHWSNDGKPQLVEEYTYTKLQLNPGLTDRDFDPKNPNYNLE